MTIASWINFSLPTYGDYTYPEWSHIIGGLIAAFTILQVPFWAVVVIFKHWRQGRWISAFHPTNEWECITQKMKTNSVDDTHL